MNWDVSTDADIRTHTCMFWCRRVQMFSSQNRRVQRHIVAFIIAEKARTMGQEMRRCHGVTGANPCCKSVLQTCKSLLQPWTDLRSSRFRSATRIEEMRRCHGGKSVLQGPVLCITRSHKLELVTLGYPICHTNVLVVNLYFGIVDTPSIAWKHNLCPISCTQKIIMILG